MEILEQHLEEKFLIKLFAIMKALNLSDKKQYEIATIFKTKYVEELLDISDDPDINIFCTLRNVQKYTMINYNKQMRPISKRMFYKYCEEYRKMLQQERKEIEAQNSLYYFCEYDTEINTYAEYY